LLIWLAPLGIVLMASPFRAFARDLVFLIPTICLFAADAINPTTAVRRFSTVALAILLLGRTLWGMWLPGDLSVSAGVPARTGIVARPAGWPSREAAEWLLSHTDSTDAVLVTTFSYPDPLQIELRGQRRLGVAWNHWEWLQDPAQKVKFVVFVADVGEHAPYFARYAETHFRRVAGDFAGYTIYDCQKDGHFVAYPDAFNSAGVYVQRGIDLLQRKQCDQAIEAFKTAVQVDPTVVAAQHDLVVAYLECGRKEDAAQVGAEIIQKEPNDPLINADMAILYLELGRIEDGLAQCRKNILLNIAPAISYGVLGQLLEKQGDLTAARDAYEKSLSFDPTNEVTRQLLVNIQAKLQQNPPVR
jgi:predicted negative regulator of RcsB-dependent stress response